MDPSILMHAEKFERVATVTAIATGTLGGTAAFMYEEVTGIHTLLKQYRAMTVGFICQFLSLCNLFG